MPVNSRTNVGFGLLELIVVLVITSLLVAVAVPAYTGMVNRGRVAGAIADIGEISLAVERFALKNRDQFPNSLNQLDIEVPLDPWGREYQYTNIIDAAPGFGGFRKDGNLNPLNTDFDLYSMGKDGSSSGPLSAASSRDDVVRANNGAFIGLGEDY